MTLYVHIFLILSKSLTCMPLSLSQYFMVPVGLSIPMHDVWLMGDALSIFQRNFKSTPSMVMMAIPHTSILTMVPPSLILLFKLYVIYAQNGTIYLLLPFPDFLCNAQPYIVHSTFLSSHLFL